MNLADSWEAESGRWIQWAQKPGHDSYWRQHRDRFLRLLRPLGRQTVDIGCGEGRLTRHLKGLGHRVIGIDASPSLANAARALDPSMDIRIAGRRVAIGRLQRRPRGRLHVASGRRRDAARRR
jgi:2-polyprenyl-3-methyl-5-hydroxy-6-metoxy-1,4-benzoquinol methylase